MNGKSTHPLELTVAATTGKPFVRYLAQRLARAHRLLRPPLREMSLALVGDHQMAQLHQRFLGLSGPTDVLTFPLEQDNNAQALSGEVVVCVSEARRRARAEGVAVRNELLLYALHGLLHLCGFDDKTPTGFARMHRTEDDILIRLGVGPIFSIRHGSTEQFLARSPKLTHRARSSRRRGRHAARRVQRTPQ